VYKLVCILVVDAGISPDTGPGIGLGTAAVGRHNRELPVSKRDALVVRSVANDTEGFRNTGYFGLLSEKNQNSDINEN